MTQQLSKHSVWIFFILFVGLGAASLYAAPQMGNQQTSAVQTVTGCLQKGLETGGFFLISADDKHWELYPDKEASLTEHVGHTVTVTGTVPKRSAAQEEKSQPYEKKETAGKQHSDLQVSGVKVVSETCAK
jgi:hypothetical protein